MKNFLKLEEAGLFLLSLVIYSELDTPWWLFGALLLAPDIGMLGYIVNERVGAFTYNLLHHKGVAVVLYLAGIQYHLPVIAIAGIIILAHASMDRIFGYGLKYADAFKHTHLGWIGESEASLKN
jgi:hypothetical protein